MPQVVSATWLFALKKAFNVSVADVMPEILTFWKVRDGIRVVEL
jgi:hypothetical protein